MMDERRDLVDREELRRRLEENFSEVNTHAWVGAHRSVLSHLDAMPAVECPRGWTRDEVLAELDADPDAHLERQDRYSGRWSVLSRHTIPQWHPEVRRYDVRVVRVAPGPEWVPLTQLVGRTIVGETEPVEKWHPTETGYEWTPDEHWTGWSRFPVNLETGQVAVRPKAAS